MTKKLIHNFTIKAVNSKVINKTKTFTKISRRCFATIIKIDNEFKAKINLLDNSIDPTIICIPLTPKSLDLKGKSHAWSKLKDEHGRNILFIRDTYKAYNHPGSAEQYDSVREGLLLSGHIYKCDNKMYFDFEEIVAYSPKGSHITIVNVDTSKPLLINNDK